MDIIQAMSRLNKVNKARVWKTIKTSLDRYPEHLVRVHSDSAQREIWCSRSYLVQIFHLNSQWECIAIIRNAFDGHFTRYLDGITWDKIQELKAQCGRGEFEAMELFPADADVQDVSHRYIWVKRRGSLIEDMPFVKLSDLDLITIRQAAALAPAEETPCLQLQQKNA
ncbi:MAG TPA: hypothetical protein VE954_43140 [Oligoflexus sp.]|uniref:DUF7694 domain-containing protein n=1 Tax=Oligoflexus sp. TaxID=1971216 RepID=UPI002D427BA1|nr:hypothetical protein [Oligoflexus sp.]HYX39940.1 hypothetical protein [Oligoflexus sp.]